LDPLPHVLLVEDSALVTDALRVLFEGTGHRVTVATSVETALAACRADVVDVMLLDLSLGREDGLDILAATSGEGTTPRATFAMTGHDDEVTRRRCLAAGCRGVLVKPVPVRDLLRIVAQAVDGQNGG
jgi:two-component system, cell cycle response regulator DivK